MGWGALPALRPPSSTAGASAEHDTGQVLPPAGSKSRWARRRRHWRGPDSGSGEGGPRRPPGDPKRAVGVWGTGQPRLLSSLALLLPFLFSARLRLPGRGPRRQPSPSRQLPLAPCAPAPAPRGPGETRRGPSRGNGGERLARPRWRARGRRLAAETCMYRSGNSEPRETGAQPRSLASRAFQSEFPPVELALGV